MQTYGNGMSEKVSLFESYVKNEKTSTTSSSSLKIQSRSNAKTNTDKDYSGVMGETRWSGKMIDLYPYRAKKQGSDAEKGGGVTELPESLHDVVARDLENKSWREYSFVDRSGKRGSWRKSESLGMRRWSGVELMKRKNENSSKGIGKFVFDSERVERVEEEREKRKKQKEIFSVRAKMKKGNRKRYSEVEGSFSRRKHSTGVVVRSKKKKINMGRRTRKNGGFSWKEKGSLGRVEEKKNTTPNINNNNNRAMEIWRINNNNNNYNINKEKGRVFTLPKVNEKKIVSGNNNRKKIVRENIGDLRVLQKNTKKQLEKRCKYGEKVNFELNILKNCSRLEKFQRFYNVASCGEEGRRMAAYSSHSYVFGSFKEKIRMRIFKPYSFENVFFKHEQVERDFNNSMERIVMTMLIKFLKFGELELNGEEIGLGGGKELDLFDYLTDFVEIPRIDKLDSSERQNGNRGDQNVFDFGLASYGSGSGSVKEIRNGGIKKGKNLEDINTAKYDLAGTKIRKKMKNLKCKAQTFKRKIESLRNMMKFSGTGIIQANKNEIVHDDNDNEWMRKVEKLKRKIGRYEYEFVKSYYCYGIVLENVQRYKAAIKVYRNLFTRKVENLNNNSECESGEKESRSENINDDNRKKLRILCANGICLCYLKIFLENLKEYLNEVSDFSYKNKNDLLNYRKKHLSNSKFTKKTNSETSFDLFLHTMKEKMKKIDERKQNLMEVLNLAEYWNNIIKKYTKIENNKEDNNFIKILQLGNKGLIYFFKYLVLKETKKISDMLYSNGSIGKEIADNKSNVSDYEKYLKYAIESFYFGKEICKVLNEKQNYFIFKINLFVLLVEKKKKLIELIVPNLKNEVRLKIYDRIILTIIVGKICLAQKELRKSKEYFKEILKIKKKDKFIMDLKVKIRVFLSYLNAVKRFYKNFE